MLVTLVLAFFQVLSPLAKGLFHKAISESGTAVRILFTDEPEEQAQVGISCFCFLCFYFLIFLHTLNGLF